MIPIVVLGMAAIAVIDFPVAREYAIRDKIIYATIFILLAVYAAAFLAGRAPTGPLELLFKLFRDVLGLRLRNFE